MRLTRSAEITWPGRAAVWRATKGRKFVTWTVPRGHKTRPTRTAPGHCGIKLALQTPSRRICGTKLSLLARNGPFWRVLCVLGEFCTAWALVEPSRATNFAHRMHKHGEIETNNTTARPQQGTTETGSTSAPENCSKNAHFSPTKAMAVSIPHRHKRAKAIAVSIPHRHKQAKAITVSAHRTTSPAAPTRRPWAGQAAAPVGGDDTAARHISHVIYRGHCSRRSRNGLFRVDCG